MTKFKQMVKDPSFKYFIVGLVVFLVMVGSGITLIKKLINDKKVTQQTEIIAQEDVKKSQEEMVIIEDIKTTPETKESSESENISLQTPTEISKTGGDAILQALVLGSLVYVAVLLLQKN